LKTVRPREIFSLIPEPMESFLHPCPPTGLGSPTLIESFVILALAKFVKPSRVLEFGTFTGYMTSILTQNLHDSRIVTVDFPFQNGPLPEEGSALASGSLNDAYLTAKRNSVGTPYLDRLLIAERLRVEEIKADSASEKFLENFAEESFDYIFVDGGHDRRVVERDLFSTDVLCSEGGISVWHDYGSELHPEVKNTLDEKIDSGRCLGVENTSLLLVLPPNSSRTWTDLFGS